MSDGQKVGVVGGGGFGCALALAAARAGSEVVVWSRKKRKLGHPRARVSPNIEELKDCQPIFVAVPSHHTPSYAEQLGPVLDGRHYLVHVSRGLVGDELTPISSVLRARTPCRRVGVLAGPLSARVLKEGSPVGAVVGTEFPEVANAVRAALGGPRLRIYETKDVIGVEIASAMVGLMALAAGYALGVGVEPGTLAMMMTRGMAESTRLGKRLGADSRTFFGLAGFGDLMAAVLDDGRPEIALGKALAAGKSLKQAGGKAGAHIEGVSIAKRASARGEDLGIELPISRTIAEVLEGKLTPVAVIDRLMARRTTRE